jgi:hypothetical protein
MMHDDRIISGQTREFVKLGYHFDELEAVYKQPALSDRAPGKLGLSSSFVRVRVKPEVFLTPRQLKMRLVTRRILAPFFWRKERKLKLL